MKKSLLFFLLALIFALLVFRPVIYAPYLYDDHRVIELYTNANKTEFDYKSSASNRHNPAFWIQPRPLRQITHKIDSLLWHDSPTQPHIENIIIHALCATIGFILLISLGTSVQIAAAAALLFLLNPVNVESIGIVSHRKELLSGLFLMAGLVLATRNNKRFSTTAALCFFAACCAKETAAMFPVLLLTITFGIKKNHGETLFSGQFTKYAALACGLAILFYVQIRYSMKFIGTDPGAEVYRAGHFAAGTPLTVATNAAIRSFPRYLQLLFSPAKHSINPEFDLSPTSFRLLLLPLASILAYISALVFLYKRGYRLFTPAAWILVTLAPYLFPPFLKAGATEILADRYAYIASFGAAWLICEIICLFPKWSAIPVWIMIISTFSIRSYSLSKSYESEESLWSNAAQGNPESFIAAYNHATALWKERKDFTAATAEYQRMTELNPDFGYGYMAFAEMYSSKDDYTTAIDVLTEGISRQPNYAPLLRNRAILLCMEGNIHDSLADFSAAAALGMKDPAFQHAWATALTQDMQWDRAETLYISASRLPDFSDDAMIAHSLSHDPPVKKGTTIITGDSLPFGTSAIDINGKERSIAKGLASALSGETGKIVDLSAPGTTSSQMATALSDYLAKKSTGDSAQCIIWTGHNDAFFGMDEEQIAREIVLSALECRLNGVRPIILGPIPVISTPERDRTAQQRTLESLNARLRNFCIHGNIRFVDTMKILRSHGQYNDLIDTATGNHVNIEGQNLIIKELLDFFN